MRLSTALALMSLGAAHGQPAVDAESNTHCIERLRMPVYPKLADAARISGTLTATVVLGQGGSVQQVLMDMGNASATAKQLFPPEVAKAIQASSFRRACGGKSITVVFSFVLGQELDPHGLPQSVSFGYPNRFSISVPPKTVQP
jgi:outer membrane biosynthesis protein TonB